MEPFTYSEETAAGHYDHGLGYVSIHTFDPELMAMLNEISSSCSHSHLPDEEGNTAEVEPRGSIYQPTVCGHETPMEVEQDKDFDDFDSECGDTTETGGGGEDEEVYDSTDDEEPRNRIHAYNGEGVDISVDIHNQNGVR